MASYLPPTLHEGAMNSTYFNDTDFNYQDSASTVANSSNSYLKLAGGTVTGTLTSNGPMVVNSLLTCNGGTQVNGSQNITGTSTCVTSTVTGSETVAGSITVSGVSYAAGGLVTNGSNAIRQSSVLPGNYQNLVVPLNEIYFYPGAVAWTCYLPPPTSSMAGTQVIFQRQASTVSTLTISVGTYPNVVSNKMYSRSSTVQTFFNMLPTIFTVTFVTDGAFWYTTYAN